MHLVFFDELERAGRRLTAIELVIAHQQLDLATVDAALVVELLDGELCALDLILGFGSERAGQRCRKADADRVIGSACDPRHGDDARAGAERGQHVAARDMIAFGVSNVLRHDVLRLISFMGQMCPSALSIRAGVIGTCATVPPNGFIASFIALSAAADAAAVPASPTPLAPSWV